MKKFALAALMLFNVNASRAMTVLWWNIGGGNFEPNAVIKYDNAPLESSLNKIIEEQNPDLIFLGENKAKFLKVDKVGRLSAYPYSQHFDYNSRRELGITVYSKIKFKSDYAQNVLDWKKNVTDADQEKNLYFQRSFQRVQVMDGDREINLVPFHTMMPWLDIQHDKKGLSGVSQKLGFIDVGFQITMSANNPLGYQAKVFRHFLRDFRKNSTGEWFVFGDLNIPDKVYGKQTKIFKIIKGDLNKATRVGDIEYSFPYPNTSKHSPKFQIDHVMSTLPKEELHYEFLDFPGSDHFPMLMKF